MSFYHWFTVLYSFSVQPETHKGLKTPYEFLVQLNIVHYHI